MSVRPDLVLGLVTHQGSRFRANGEAVCGRIHQDLLSMGVRTDLLVSDRNDADADRYLVSRSIVRRSAQAQAHLEIRWRSRVDHKDGGLRDLALERAIALKRSLEPPTVAMRLLNIDYSHLRIWRHSLAAGAKATLVIEDDAQLVTSDLAPLVASVMDEFTGECVLVNCSRSIDPSTLGVERILQQAPVRSRVGSVEVRDPRPTITNTVCANLYSAAFLERLVRHIDRRGLVPVLPIDWRVNDFLIENPDVSTWWLMPAPFVQGSMHPDVNVP